MEIPRRQAEKLAIAQGHDIGVAVLGDQQGKLAEEIACAELNGGRVDTYLDGPRGDKIHRVATLAFADNNLVGDGEPRPQKPGDGTLRLRIESRKHRHPLDQILPL